MSQFKATGNFENVSYMIDRKTADFSPILFLFLFCVFAGVFAFVCLEHQVSEMLREARRGRQIPLGLELLTLVSCHVGAGNQT